MRSATRLFNRRLTAERVISGPTRVNTPCQEEKDELALFPNGGHERPGGRVHLHFQRPGTRATDDGDEAEDLGVLISGQPGGSPVASRRPRPFPAALIVC